MRWPPHCWARRNQRCGERGVADRGAPTGIPVSAAGVGNRAVRRRRVAPRERGGPCRQGVTAALQAGRAYRMAARRRGGADGGRWAAWWRAVVAGDCDVDVPEEKRGARPAPGGWGAGRAPVAGGAGYRVCSIRNAWAFRDRLPPAVVMMLRSARAALASLAVRAPRMGTTWSRYSVTAL